MGLLVTGGAGYIGSVTTRRLVDAGHEVTVLDTLEKGRAEAVDPRAHLVTGSVGDQNVLDAVLPGIDAVMHLAGYIEVAEAHRLGLEWLGDGTSGEDRGGSGDGRGVGSHDGSRHTGAVLNLGNGRGLSNLEVVRTCAKVTGREVEVKMGARRPGDPAVLIASSDRAREVLGWQPQRGTLDEMVQDAWEWHSRRI